MSVNYTEIAAEVDKAIKSVASTDAGYPATIRRQSSTGGDPWDPVTTSTYTTVRVIEENRRVRSADGTYVDMVKRTLTMAATPGFTPQKADDVALGITESEATADSKWLVITEVRALAPAGVAVLYEIELST
jgi:hypothetical protein